MSTLTTKSKAYTAARTKLGDHRKTFDSLADAISTLRSIFAIPEFPGDFPVVAARVGLVDVTGDGDSIPPLDKWPTEYSGEGVTVCVTFIGMRGIKGDDGKETNGARGFAVYPLHPMDAIRLDDSGEIWLNKIIEKEASHVALRGLRNVNPALGTDALVAAAMDMPLSISDYVEESTREGLDSTAFDALWKNFRKMLSENPATAALVIDLPGKADVVKSIRSKAFAAENYDKLESMGAFVFIADSMARILDHMKAEAIKSGEDFELDSAEIKAWVSTRNEKVFATPKKIGADLSTVNFAAFMASTLPGIGETEEVEDETATAPTA